jgi:hypothetical protein
MMAWLAVIDSRIGSCMGLCCSGRVPKTKYSPMKSTSMLAANFLYLCHSIIWTQQVGHDAGLNRVAVHTLCWRAVLEE